MNCEKGCYEVDIQSCEDIKLIAGLNANAPYYVILKKPTQSNSYQRIFTTDNAGTLIIEQSKFPAGYFTTGNYINIELRMGDAYATRVAMIFSEKSYNCVLLKLVELAVEESDTSEINVIQ